MEYKTIAARILLVILIPLPFGGFALSEDKPTKKEAEKIAEKVRRKAELSEKAEGSQDLVKDKVTVKTGDDGQPVVEQIGEASFYGQGFHGKKTATGEKFDQNDLTAAHPTLPLGTQATVTNLETGKSVDVEINDRGPYVKGRDIDLSKGAAKELDMTKDGVAPVKIEAEVAPGNKSKAKKSRGSKNK
ncbi:MAG: septal ring lytic transglycosylase RlpA family protein [Candidatus Binatia bacterium]